MAEKEDNKTGPGSSKEEGALPQYGLADEILGRNSGREKDRPDEGSGSSGNGGEADTDAMKYVTFFLDLEEYGLPISQVQEINRVTEITRVPNSPEHVMGVMNLRGRIVPVIELKNRLNLGKAEIKKDSRIVVVEHGPKILGLLVDRVAQVLNISDLQIEDAPEEVIKIDENFIRGVAKMEDRMVILIELEKVVEKREAA